jgi:hypothetical protein
MDMEDLGLTLNTAAEADLRGSNGVLAKEGSALFFLEQGHTVGYLGVKHAKDCA